MSTSAQLITPPPNHRTLRRRLERLEQRCAELWTDEPVTPGGRERAFARLADIEHRIVGLILRRLADPDDPALIVAAEECERDLEQLGALWTSPRAA